MPWFPYKPAGDGLMPSLNAHLVRNGQRSIAVPFLVDSGAAISKVSRVYVNRLIPDLNGAREQDTGAKDANNNPVRGVPVEFDVDIPGLPVTRERIWVCSADTWALLGQTWFERFGVHFENFPFGPKLRRFAMNPCPWPAPPPNPRATEGPGQPSK
jgi:hypothetical protein